MCGPRTMEMHPAQAEEIRSASMERSNQGEANASDARIGQGSASQSDTRGTGQGSNGGGRGRGNAANLSREARVKGGQRSAQVQVRDEHGQFAGRSDKARSRDNQGGQQGSSGNQQGRGSDQQGRGDSGENAPGRS